MRGRVKRLVASMCVVKKTVVWRLPGQKVQESFQTAFFSHLGVVSVLFDCLNQALYVIPCFYPPGLAGYQVSGIGVLSVLQLDC